MWVRSLGQEDPLEEGMATHSSILAWRIPTGRGEEPGGVQPMGLHRVGHGCATKHSTVSKDDLFTCWLHLSVINMVQKYVETWGA